MKPTADFPLVPMAMNEAVLAVPHKLFEVQGTNLMYVEIKCQLDATDYIFADFIACSTCFGHSIARNMLSMQ